jgi:hypothetical protein
MGKRMTSKTISKTMTGRMIKILSLLANKIGILWPLSCANISLTTLLLFARRKIQLTRIRRTGATNCTLRKVKEEAVKEEALCCSAKAEKEAPKERAKARKRQRKAWKRQRSSQRQKAEGKGHTWPRSLSR